MAEDDYTCLERVVKTVHVALPMSYAGNPAAGVKEYLDTWKCQYIPVLDGLVVDYKKVTFETPLGRIINDQACLHYDVRAEFSLFKPSTGKLLKGVVNRVSTQHVGCVVHDSINASIHISEDHVDFNLIALDNVVLFEVTNVEIHKKVIRLKGIFTEKSIELSRSLYPNQYSSSHILYDAYDEGAQPSNNDAAQLELRPGKGKRKYSKSKRSDFSIDNGNMDDGVNAVEDMNDTYDEGAQPSNIDVAQCELVPGKRKRKHSESKRSDFSIDNGNVDDDDVNAVKDDSLSPPKKKKKKKKRKHTDLDETMEDYRETLDAENESSLVVDRDSSSYSEIGSQDSSFVDRGEGSSKKKKKKKSKKKELDESFAGTSYDYVKPRKKHKKSSVDY